MSYIWILRGTNTFVPFRSLENWPYVHLYAEKDKNQTAWRQQIGILHHLIDGKGENHPAQNRPEHRIPSKYVKYKEFVDRYRSERDTDRQYDSLKQWL